MLNNLPNSHPTADDDHSDSLQAYFKPDIAPDDIEEVFRLKRAQPVLQAFTALFHGGFDGVLVRLLVLRELCSDTQQTFTRADINMRLGYMTDDSLETVLSRLRSYQLLAWDAQQSVYRVTPMARNILAGIESLLNLAGGEDDVEMGFILSQVAGAQAVGGVTAEQLQHLLGRLVDLTEEFRDAIASGSEFRLRTAQDKWNMACDWVEKGSEIIQSITSDANADAATHRAAQAIGRAQSALLNMQGMFSRALNQIERQRVQLGQSGLSTTDIKTWLLKHEDISSLAEGSISMPLTPMFITPGEMIDVTEAELLSVRADANNEGLPSGEDAIISGAPTSAMMVELDEWLDKLASFTATPSKQAQVHESILPASFAVASYRASMLPLLGDAEESSLQGATARLARLPLHLQTYDELTEVDDEHVKAMSHATLTAHQHLPQPDSEHGDQA